MTKIAVVFIVLLLPCFVRADDSMLGQMLDAQIASLEREYSEKMSVLQQCEKETKGFKIAGITTLTLTGVGIYANQKLSEKLKQSSTGGGGTENRFGGECDHRRCLFATAECLGR